jgi:hypothetical protein
MFSDADRSYHRHHAVLQQQAQERKVHICNLADQTEIGSICHEFARPQQHVIHAAKANCIPPVHIDEVHNLFIDQAGKHHENHFNHSLVRIALTVDERGIDAECAGRLGNLFSAAMNNDDIDADFAQNCDILGECLLQLLVGHYCSAILYHKRLSFIRLYIRQRLDQHFLFSCGVNHDR